MYVQGSNDSAAKLAIMYDSTKNLIEKFLREESNFQDGFTWQLLFDCPRMQEAYVLEDDLVNFIEKRFSGLAATIKDSIAKMMESNYCEKNTSIKMVVQAAM